MMKNVTGYDLCKRPGGLVGHARGDDRGDHQGAAAPRRPTHPAASGCPTRPRSRRCASATARPSRFGRRASASRARRALFDRAARARAHRVTAIRVENFAASARYRAGRLKADARRPTAALELDDGEQLARSGADPRPCACFRGRRAAALADLDRPSARPEARRHHRRARSTSACSRLGRRADLARDAAATDAGAVEIRRALADIRRPCHADPRRAAMRAAIDVFEPLDGPLAALTGAAQGAFDPAGILNPGRMYAGV